MLRHGLFNVDSKLLHCQLSPHMDKRQILETNGDMYTPLHGASTSRVLTNLAKWNSPSFPCFPDPLNNLFQTIIKWKPDVTNHLSSQFGSFLAELQNILLNEHGDWLYPCQSLSTNHFTLLLLTIMHTARCPRDRLQNEKQHPINSLSKF